MRIRPLSAGDAAAVLGFVNRLPEGERTFLRDDLSSLEQVQAWLPAGGSRRLAAEAGDAIVGTASITPRLGWSSHVGELQLAVDPAYRRRGVGRRLVQQALITALEMQLTKIVVEAVADQVALVAMFQGLGFEPEALLSDHVRDRDGNLHDLLVLSHDVESMWPSLAAVGIEDELQGP